MSFISQIHNNTEFNQQWNVFSAFNPSKYTHTWSSGQPILRPGSSWGSGALLKGLISVVDNSCRSRGSNPQPRVTSSTLYPLEPRQPPRRSFASVQSRFEMGPPWWFMYDTMNLLSERTSTWCLRMSGRKNWQIPKVGLPSHSAP